MTKFNETDAGRAFIADGIDRETDAAIMRAIAFFARNEQEAEQIWNGDFGNSCTLINIWEHATNNGAISDDLWWGDSNLRDLIADAS